MNSTKIKIAVNIEELPKETWELLLDLLYRMEDETNYNNKTISKAIDQLQKEIL
jgi:hypothetical protein